MNGDSEVVDQERMTNVFIVISRDVSAGACLVHLPSDTSLKFDGVGRDDDGPFLRTDTGSIIRFDFDWADTDELLSKQSILLQQLDEVGEFVNEYAITQVEPETRIGFVA
jgi:hypothetical protein